VIQLSTLGLMATKREPLRLEVLVPHLKKRKVLHSENVISYAEAFSKPILADAAKYAENMDLAHCPLEDRESQMARLKAYIAASHPRPPILE
jgi:hypothetical protein